MSGPVQEQGSVPDMDELAELPGLEVVSEQLAGMIAVIQAEVARREAGIAVTRPAWKNLVFAGEPGGGKSRAAGAVGRIYRALGVLSSGHLIEVAGAELTGSSSRETSSLMRQAAGRASRGILLINDPLASHPADPRQLRHSLLEVLGHYRDDLIIILAGQADQLRALLHSSQALASRFPGFIEFPGYTSGQLAAIFVTLAGEAGFTLTAAARRKAATVLGQAVSAGTGSGSARLAVRLLSLATAAQARRVTTARQATVPAALGTIRATDIPDHLYFQDLLGPTDDEWPGQYL